MIHRRAALGLIASAGAISASSIALAKEKRLVPETMMHRHAPLAFAGGTIRVRRM
jgi:hypothetical protein